MCGIGGSFIYSDSEDPVCDKLMQKLGDSMDARGPDHAGSWISLDKRVGLVHRRLSIIDLSENANQPMVENSSGNQIVFNGEIFNYCELKLELEQMGYEFRTNSDTEVLLKLYSKYGEKMLERLRGMFAFAIWNEQDKSLFLARDHFGIKPLYYSDDGKTFLFSSQVKSLLTTKKCGHSIDPAGHVGFFLWGHVPEPFTLYSDISPLPAGSYLTISYNGKKTQGKFFNLKEEFSMRSPESYNGYISNESVCADLYNSLADSVKAHLISDVPVGLFMSAGADSTTLLALMAKYSSNQIQTFTLGFGEYENTFDDETGLAQSTALSFGAKHTNHRIHKKDFLDNIDDMTAAMDQPTIDGVNTYYVSKAASEAGLKVAISGLGGDELFGGYTSFKEIPLLVNSVGFTKNIPLFGKGFRLVTSKFLKHFTSPKYAGLFEYGNNYGGAYLLRRGLFMPWELPSVLDGEIVKAGWSRLQAAQELNNHCDTIENPISKVSALEHSCYMKNRLLRDTDWASMAHSLEVRVPMVDIILFRKVIEIRNSGSVVSKSELINSFGNTIPEFIKRRKKTGFSIPVSTWIENEGLSKNNARLKGIKLWASVVHQRALN